MKKARYILLLTTLAILAMAACAPVEEPTVGSTQQPMLDATVQAVTDPVETAPATQQAFQPIVLVENDDVCVKINGVDNDPIWGYSLNVYLENKTDKELMFTVDDVSVNRYMCDPFWAESVGAGMKSNSSISWFESSLEENSISDVQEIIFTLRVYDANDFYADDVLLETFTITP